MNTKQAARVVIGGLVCEVGGGLVGETFVERPELHLAGSDVRPRGGSELRFCVAHTTQGIAISRLEEGAGPDVGRDRFVAEMWRRDRRAAGAHVVVDFDGSIVCCADLVYEAASHAGHVNGCSWGLEICQRPRSAGALVWEAQAQAAARVIHSVALALNLPRTFALGPLGTPLLGFVSDRPAHLDPRVGLWAHSNVSTKRGPGDPGPWVALELRRAHGWEGVRVEPFKRLGGVGD